MVQNFIGLLKLTGCFILSFITAFFASVTGLIIGGQKAWEFWSKAWAKIHLLFLGAKFELNGQENLKGPAVFIMNHESVIDIFTIAAICPKKTTFISKKEVGRFPFVGIIMRMGGCIFIDRSNTRSAVESIKEGLKKRRDNYSIIIFPEGTRSTAEQDLKPFKRGCMHTAIQANLPIVPIGQHGARSYADGKSLLMRKGGKIFIEVGTPIMTSEWTTAASTEQMEELQLAVKNLVEKAKLRSKKALEKKKNIKNINHKDFSNKSL